MSELDTITTDQMIEELKNRHPAALIVIVEDHKTRKDVSLYCVNYCGGVAHAMGLAEYARLYLAEVAKPLTE